MIKCYEASHDHLVSAAKAPDLERPDAVLAHVRQVHRFDLVLGRKRLTVKTMATLTDRSKRILNESIPERLSELYGCARIIEAFEARGDPALSAKIDLGGPVLTCSPAGLLIVSPCLDTALMTCRTLLTLLGVGLNKSQTNISLRTRRRFPTDAWMTDFGLAPIPPDELCKGHAPLTDAEVRKLLISILKAANKGIGHLTDESTRDIISRAGVARTCDVVVTLVNRHIYKALGEPAISFQAGSKYGNVATA
jgi:hypothetical protein